jgi:hydroxymethylglutaryl-CoA lyase
MSVKIVECPRDAMQGFHSFIETADKVRYINALLKVGFYALDCGSFVSAKSVPHLADTATVLNTIDKVENGTKLLVIAANERGASQACEFDSINVIGFPFSISEQFQLRNTKQNFQQATDTLTKIQSICKQNNKELLVYLSMGFGNPYGEPWSVDLAFDWCKKLADLGVTQINLSDTVGKAQANDIAELFDKCLQNLPEIEFGAHLHTRPDNYLDNIAAAYNAGCRKFDSAIQGFGGCPFATDKLTGNLPTENLLHFLNQSKINHSINESAFNEAFALASGIFV